MIGNKVRIKVICTKVMYCNLDQVPLDYIIIYYFLKRAYILYLKIETWVSVLHFLLTFTVLFICLNKVRKGEERGKKILFCFLHIGVLWFCQCLTRSCGKEEHISLRKKMWCLLMCSICE